MSGAATPAFDVALLEMALAGILPPVTVAAVALGLAWKPWRRGRVTPGRATAWGAPLAIGLGYAAGHLGTHGWPRFHPWPQLLFQVPEIVVLRLSVNVSLALANTGDFDIVTE